MNGSTHIADAQPMWLERRGGDFPYYRGTPVSIGGVQWLLLLVAAGIALGILILPPPFLRGPVGAIGTGVVLFLLPLLTLIVVARRGWTAIFRPLQFMDFVWMVVFAIINLLVTLATGWLLINSIETTANAAVAGSGSASGPDQVLLFIRAIPQLFGEELVSILPFLAMLWLFTRWSMSRTLAVLAAWVLAGVLFAAMHLSTYGYNVIQALAGVGVARLVLLTPYIMTKNIWVSTGAHILNDWIFFGISILGAAATAGAVDG